MIELFRDEYFFLSNFCPVRIEYEKVWHASVEHAYQAAKTLDPAQKKIIRDAPTAAKAKQRGNHVPLRHDWSEVKLSVMRILVYKKFKDNEELRKMLHATGTLEIVHMNNWGDTFWGKVGDDRVGHNHLGRILMAVRGELK